MHNTELILTLTCGLAASLGLGFLTQRVGLSPIVGYLLAGIAVGPHTPGFVADSHLAEQLAEIGVVLLMFVVGLQFHLKDLLAVRSVAVPGAMIQITFATALGTGVAKIFGYGWPASIMFGLCISVASTVVLTRILSDRNELHTALGHTAVGWLVVQDIFAVFALVVLPFLLAPTGSENLVWIICVAALKIVVLAWLVLFAGGKMIPWLLRHIAATRSRELFTLSVLVFALGIAAGSALLFGVSMALGAFLAGMVVGRSDFSLRAATDALPMRDAFAVLFFVSVGMLFDPRFLLKSPGLVAAALLVVVVGTPLVTAVVMLVLGRPISTAIGLALALAQIGEFSFILATLGKKQGVLPDEFSQVIVIVAILSIAVNPLIANLGSGLCRVLTNQSWLSRQIARSRLETAQIAGAIAELRENPAFSAIIVGYGPVGRTLVRILRENDIEPTVIELNMDAILQLRQAGIRAVYGDANHPATLRAAQVDKAGTLFLASSGLTGAEEVVRLAKELNPSIRVIVRTAYLRDRTSILKAGASEVFTGEGEVALALAESVLRNLGATPEKIDRERDQVRSEVASTREVKRSSTSTPILK